MGKLQCCVCVGLSFDDASFEYAELFEVALAGNDVLLPFLKILNLFLEECYGHGVSNDMVLEVIFQLCEINEFRILVGQVCDHLVDLFLCVVVAGFCQVCDFLVELVNLILQMLVFCVYPRKHQGCITLAGFHLTDEILQRFDTSLKSLGNSCILKILGTQLVVQVFVSILTRYERPHADCSYHQHENLNEFLFHL